MKQKMKKFAKKVSLFTFNYFMFSICWFAKCSAHGRMENPPARNAAWRHGFNTPVNYNDVELNCGGIGIQHYLSSINVA